MPDDGPEFFVAADDEHIRREKAKARELRQSQWWKNQRGQGLCYYCRERFHPHDLTMDHLVPVVRGGRSSRGNVVPCCKECNSKKRYYLPVEWQEYLNRLAQSPETRGLARPGHQQGDEKKMQNLKVAVVGLDTSHSIELPRLAMSPETTEDKRVDGLTFTRCLRFETPFQNKEGLDKRQATLESWGIKVTENFDEAIADCDAIMIEINDPAFHLDYFKRVAALGKPVFLDKPLAGTLADGRAILDLAKKHSTRVWSGSSLPLTPTIPVAIAALGDPIVLGHTFGALGNAPAGNSLIWYGVHSFEMLQRLMGMGAQSVYSIDNGVSVVSSVNYSDNRRGLVESIRGMWSYGGRVQSVKSFQSFTVDNSRLYFHLLNTIRDFFRGGPAPISMEQTFEGLAMMEAANQSIATGKEVAVETF